MRNRGNIVGCILGGAIGDCLGGPFEGRYPPFALSDQHKWRVSDDTQLTLATCESISRQVVVDPAAIAESFASWFKQGRLVGLGASTYKALSELSQGGHWALVGRRGDMAAGNGAAMRIAPLAFCLDPTDRDSRKVIRDVCRVTHHNEEAYAGALAVLIAVRAAFDQIWNGTGSLLELVIDHLPDSSVRDRIIQLSKYDNAKPLVEIAAQHGSSGYVVESIPLAILAAERIGTLGFSSMLHEVVACGGDTDTNASIAGQIAGTLIGVSGLPKEYSEQLPDFEMISGIALQFAESIGSH
jgi:ADP-ribosyl-[dinitrogen reductase] hydrolase